MRLKIVDQLEAEVRELERELRVDIPKEIKKALEHGDLRENAEYHAALERQEHVRIRLGHMQRRLRHMTMISPGDIPRDRVGYGAKVRVVEEGREGEQWFHLVSSEEVDADRGMISLSSPLGRAFVGKVVGDEVEVRAPSGVRNFEIQEIVSIHDQ